MAEEVTEHIDNVNIDDWDRDEGFVCDETDIRTAADNSFLLLAKVISDRPVNTSAFCDRMAGVWRPVKKVEIQEIEPLIYCLRFFHELDVDRVLSNGPWSFEQRLVVVKKFDLGMVPAMYLCSTLNSGYRFMIFRLVSRQRRWLFT